MATVRKTLSGCGIRIVTRPSVVVSAVIPKGEPLGFRGYSSVISCRLLTNRAQTRPESLQACAAAASGNSA